MALPDQYPFKDRLLAEALRLHEDDGRAPIDDPLAELHAQSVEGHLEAKVIARARSAQIAGKLRDALRQIRAAIGWIVLLGVILAFLLGAATARATLGTAADGVVNFYWVLGGVLGIQTIALIAWFIVMIAAMVTSLRTAEGRQSSHTEPASLVSLGAAVIAAAQWLARRFAREAHQYAAISAAARVNSAGALGRWTFSSITHLLWLSFNIGCISLIFYLLAMLHYTFVWETTILSPERYVTLTRGIAALPDRVGIITPDREQIRNSQSPPPADATAPAADASEAWAGLLVGSLVLYGFAPRLLLLGYSLGRRRVERRRFRLDTTLAGFARLEHRLMPRTVTIGKVGDDGAPIASPIAVEPGLRAQPSPRAVSSSHAILGIETERPQGNAWPPSVHGIEWDDLGIIEGGDEQRAVLARLESAQTEPASLAIVCALTTTPDRGIERFIAQSKSRLSQPVALILTAGQSLRVRGYSADEVAQRIADWRELARRAGLPGERVLELDLDHLTESSRKRLKDVLTAEPSQDSESARRIEQAFDLIAEQAEQWERSTSAPDAQSQAELHKRIAALYQSQQSSWRELLHAPASLKGDIAAHLRTGAERVQSLLPDRLRRSPKWIAAGGLAGALGCVAAATLISPIAIGALPMWSAIGAAITTIWQPSRRDGSPERSDAGKPDRADAVRAAALFALLLELQGRDEATITRALDEAIGPDAETSIASAKEARAWLDAVRHRLDLSLAARAAR